MSQSHTRTTVTAALPYANGPLHIGHLAGAYLPADIFVRYLRQKGQDVHFLCGSDEHGVAIIMKAMNEGLTPREVIDKYDEMMRQTFVAYDIQFDVYSRTSSPIHHANAQEFFLRFHETGQLEEKTTEQYYDPEAKMFLADRYILGTCPKCGNENAYGDQCERCGSSLSPTDLINPRSAVSGAKPVLKPTKHWFLPLDRWQQRIEEYILGQHNDWKTNVFGQCKSWLQEGLQPRAITRDLDWGVPVPLPEAEGKVLYVWFDAPIGYISASKDWAQRIGQPDAWKKYWLKQESGGHTRLVHFIGKDNIVFHCIIFPAILMGHGSYIQADNVPANEFLNLEGEKISTSRNWAVWLHEFAAEHPDKIDVMRYYLTSILPETSDADFIWQDFLARNNNELVAVLGNFVNRVLTLIQKYYGGEVPEAIPTPEDHLALLEIKGQAEEVGQHVEAFRFRQALQAAMELARSGNKYLQEAEPWKRISTDPERVRQVLFTSVQLVAGLGAIFRPFLPRTSENIFRMLEIAPVTDWDTILHQWRFVPSGHRLGQPELLFQKLDDTIVKDQLAKLAAAKAANAAKAATKVGNTTAQQAPQSDQEEAKGAGSLPPPKPAIEFPDFEKIDLRVATVTAAERVPKADKLLKLTLETGLDVRTVVSGIAEHYSPEQVVGQQVVLLANLAPRKLRGVESQGMILMAEDSQGRLRFVSPAEAMPNGGTVR